MAKKYTTDELYQQAVANQNAHNASKPGAYTYGENYNIAKGYADQIANRDPFSYDVNSDALYQQLKDQYIQQGNLAMRDTMGQAAAMTGGYGNSYAQTAGQQMYNQYMNQLSGFIPELENNAYQRYQQEGQDLQNLYNLYMDMENQDMDKWKTDTDLWYKENERLAGETNALYEQRWNEYLVGREDAANTRSDLINLIAATGYEPTKAEREAAGLTEKQVEGYLNAYKTSSTTTGGNSVKYETFDADTRGAWENRAKKKENWSGLMTEMRAMTGANINPVYAVDVIIDAALNNPDIKSEVTESGLADLANMLKGAGVSDEIVGSLYTDWMGQFKIQPKIPEGAKQVGNGFYTYRPFKPLIK